MGFLTDSREAVFHELVSKRGSFHAKEFRRLGPVSIVRLKGSPKEVGFEAHKKLIVAHMLFKEAS